MLERYWNLNIRQFVSMRFEQVENANNFSSNRECHCLSIWKLSNRLQIKFDFVALFRYFHRYFVWIQCINLLFVQFILFFFSSVKTDLMENGANSTLFIAKVRKKDTGSYTCSIGPNDSYTINVQVLNGNLVLIAILFRSISFAFLFPLFLIFAKTEKNENKKCIRIPCERFFRVRYIFHFFCRVSGAVH